MKPVWKDFGCVGALALLSGYVVAQIVHCPDGWRVWVRSFKDRKNDLEVVGVKLTKEEAIKLADERYNNASQSQVG